MTLSRSLTLGLMVATVIVTLATASDVVDVTDANYDEVIKSAPLVLVEFYAPWCGHCKKLVPEWEIAATGLKGKAVIAKMDATEQKEVPQKLNIQGYPTIKIYRDGVVSGDYEGKRTGAGIVDWVVANTGPAIIVVDSAEELETLKKENAVTVVAFVAEGSNPFLVFESVAKQYRSAYRFVHASAALAGDHADKIVVFKHFDELTNVYAGPAEAKELGSFIVANGMKSFDEMGPDNYKNYMDKKEPIAWLFALDDEKSAAAKEAVASVASEFKGKVSFVWIDAGKFGGMAQRVGLKGDKFPSFAVDFEEQHFVFDQSKEIVAEDIKTFVSAYVAGTLEASVQTEEEPAQHTVKGLTTVVGTTFDSLVQNSADADVLIEFYAPWCGHCKSLVPVYQDLAERTENVDGVRIAMMDATANDFDKKAFAVQGFPTIMFVPKNGGKPESYDGDRTADGMLEFLKIKSSAKFPEDNADL